MREGISEGVSGRGREWMREGMSEGGDEGGRG